MHKCVRIVFHSEVSENGPNNWSYFIPVNLLKSLYLIFPNKYTSTENAFPLLVRETVCTGDDSGFCLSVSQKNNQDRDALTDRYVSVNNSTSVCLGLWLSVHHCHVFAFHSSLFCLLTCKIAQISFYFFDYLLKINLNIKVTKRKSLTGRTKQ